MNDSNGSHVVLYSIRNLNRRSRHNDMLAYVSFPSAKTSLLITHKDSNCRCTCSLAQFCFCLLQSSTPMACRETSFVPLPLVVVVKLSCLAIDEYVFPPPRPREWCQRQSVIETLERIYRKSNLASLVPAGNLLICEWTWRRRPEAHIKVREAEMGSS